MGGDKKNMGGDEAIFSKMGSDHPPSLPTTKNPGVRVKFAWCRSKEWDQWEVLNNEGSHSKDIESLVLVDVGESSFQL